MRRAGVAHHINATVGFININQNERVSKLTSIGVVLMPINILAGIGEMSEFSMMIKDFSIERPITYAGLILGSVVIGWATYHVLKFFERRAAKRTVDANDPEEAWCAPHGLCRCYT
jgi:magnesium transporter